MTDHHEHVLPPVDTLLCGRWPIGTMRASAILDVGKVGSTEMEIPGPELGHVLIAPTTVGICGTDLELLHGTASYVRDGRAVMPHVYGHEWTGRVVAIAGNCQYSQQLNIGDRVVGQTMISCGGCRACQRGRRNECSQLKETGLYGQQGAAAEYIRLPAQTLTVVPPGVDDLAAALVEPAVTVLAGLDKVGVFPGERVLVMGTGTIGLLAVQMVRRVAGTVDVVGVDDAGIGTALRMGAEHAFTPGQARDGGYDVVIEASGSTTALLEALRVVDIGGRIAAIGVPNESLPSVDAAEMVLRGVTMIGVRHGLDYYERTLRLFADGVLTAKGMIADTFELDRADEAFELLEHGRRAAPKVALALTPRP
ncbi:zinc-dependent alcohol dehydrogenase [Streptomyces sp. DT24]|uniref:zinc-dependent alcohol dehydrogenase n=1 Tax=unclassified Streptomyces TaxID=2593676 RepID=UPI0023B8E65C|nr:alcohol dehydrogenase catalytic domain-containing protein [Streptomyces sp. AM 4-1-1]WEH34592.1 alcohol dehydrogenase catalytic domain-containing protein [Streptomyces sp. AM 4-1-1]